MISLTLLNNVDWSIFFRRCQIASLLIFFILPVILGCIFILLEELTEKRKIRLNKKIEELRLKSIKIDEEYIEFFGNGEFF